MRWGQPGRAAIEAALRERLARDLEALPSYSPKALADERVLREQDVLRVVRGGGAP